MHKETSPLMYYIVSEVYIARRFLKDGSYSQQTLSAVAKESLISYDLTERVPVSQNLLYCDAKYHAKPNQINVNDGLSFLNSNFCFIQT